ncbi:MAG: DNA polymerase III subunit gamma/tau [Firmicutes bacterium]|nr:DNA polymerase III subunit gamma/tau [Bacillota bacterium]
MAHQALYRKWRPTVFEDIVGQEHITRTLKNQIINDKIAHAYLFCGTRGTGKTSCAKVFSRAVNCLNTKNGSPCNECGVCRGILNGSILDVKEIDAASNNGVDNIREIREDAQYVSADTKYTVYIIDEVHMLSTGAFNALLKILEEPPQNVIFILATTEAHKVPQTILSRCQRFDFKRIKPEDIILRMKEIAHGDKLDISEDGYKLLARLADGSMRDGLSILERVISTTSETVTAELITDILGISDEEQIFAVIGACQNGDADKILSVIDEVTQAGKDLKVFADSVISMLRDLLIIKVSENAQSILNYSAESFVKVSALCSKMTFESISNAIKILSDAQTDAKWVKSPRVIFELAFIKIARPEVDSSPDAFENRLSALEAKSAAPQNDGFNSAVIRKLDELEKRIDMGVVPAANEEKPREKKRSAPPLRMYNPIPDSELTSDNPLVLIARKWDAAVNTIKRAYPEFASVFRDYNVTIDRDGIILLYKRGAFSYKLAVENRDKIIAAFQKYTQSDYTIKIAYEDEMDGNIIDFWRLDDGAEKPADPLESLASLSIVENVDDSEFTTVSSDDAGYSQSSLEDDREEFLEDEEKKDEQNE